MSRFFYLEERRKENGNNSIDPINLKSHSKVNPTMRKGKAINQMIGKNSKSNKATGQQNSKSKHHNTIERNKFISI